VSLDEPTTVRQMLVRYVLARHPSHDFELSAELRNESQVQRDITAFDMQEGRPATGKKSGQAGYWGLEAEVGMSRKTFAWYSYAVATYPLADYVMKADDDLYLRVEAYLASLELLAKVHRLYWGLAMRWGAKKNDPSSKFAFVGGMAITMSRDLAEWIATSDRGAMNMGAYHGDRDRYKATNHDHEDVMVGRMFYDASVPHTVVKDCRFHDIHAGANIRPLQTTSIGIHHVKPGEYKEYRQRFADAEPARVEEANAPLRAASLPARMRSAPVFQSLLSTARTRDIGGPTCLLHPYFSIARCKCSEGTSSCPLSTHLAPPTYAILL
jgi:hypothetical protein